mgnify:CR=1 FL=1
MKKNILKKFAIAIASTSLALTAPVMSDASVFGTIQTVEAATVKTPGTVKLNKISAPAYNKIKISWKKASNATKYYVYYRKSGTKKWKKIANVKSSATSYTHTASYKYPLTVGQKYDYTVKAYNSKSKKSGKYNTKGLTVKTVPNAITNFTPLVLSNNTVQLTWTRSMGADKYVVYRKASATADWQKLATLNGTYYVDKAPVVNQESYYMVKPYVSKYKVYGKFDADGVKVYVKHNTPTTTPAPKPTETPEPTEKPQPTVTPKPTEKPQPTETPATPTPEPTKKPEQPSPSPTPTEKPATPTPKPTEKPQPTPTPTTKPEPNAEQMAQEVIRLVNEERAKVGKAPLQYNAKLQEIAMLRAKEISILFSHDRPDGRLFDTAFGETGVGCPDGENIAKGSLTPERVMRIWMNSLGHKVAILSPTATHIGVGFYKATNGVYYWVQDFSSGPDKTYAVTCNANGGTFSDGQEVKTFHCPADVEIEFAKYISTPTRDGYTFAGWSFYGDIYTGIGLTDNIKLTATWTANN